MHVTSSANAPGITRVFSCVPITRLARSRSGYATRYSALIAIRKMRSASSQVGQVLTLEQNDE